MSFCLKTPKNFVYFGPDKKSSRRGEMSNFKCEPYLPNLHHFNSGCGPLQLVLRQCSGRKAQLFYGAFEPIQLVHAKTDSDLPLRQRRAAHFTFQFFLTINEICQM